MEQNINQLDIKIKNKWKNLKTITSLPVTNLSNNDSGDLLADFHNIFNRWKN
jgi:hypothetical protein